MQQIDTLSTTTESEGLVNLLEVYADDFIAMSNNTSHAHLLQIYRAMLHSIHAILPPTAVTSHNGFNPVAPSKLEKGEIIWEHVKEILGCIMDIIQLPVKKYKDICVFMRKFLKKRHVMLNEFQKIAGKLKHASMVIPGGRSLFTPIDMAILGHPYFILITPTLLQFLEDWRCLVQ